VLEAFLLGHVLGRQEELAQKGSVVFPRPFDPGDVLLGDDQHMDGSHRVNIPESQDLIAFPYFLGRQFSPHDTAKDAILRHVLGRPFPHAIRQALPLLLQRPGSWRKESFSRWRRRASSTSSATSSRLETPLFSQSLG